MDHTKVLSYDNSSWNRRRWRMNIPPPRVILMAMAVRQCNTELIPQCSMTRASPEATGRCHQVTTRSVSPWWPPVRQSTQWKCNMYPLCWSFRWPSRCGGTIPCTLPDGGGSRLSYKATKRRHRASTRSDRHQHQSDMPTPISGVYFIIKLLKNSSSCSNNNRGVTHQTDEKHLNNMSEYFVGVVNIAFNRYNNRFVLRIINHYLLKFLYNRTSKNL